MILKLCLLDINNDSPIEGPPLRRVRGLHAAELRGVPLLRGRPGVHEEDAPPLRREELPHEGDPQQVQVSLKCIFRVTHLIASSVKTSC